MRRARSKKALMSILPAISIPSQMEIILIKFWLLHLACINPIEYLFDSRPSVLLESEPKPHEGSSPTQTALPKIK
jgi:hypothetical protein